MYTNTYSIFYNLQLLMSFIIEFKQSFCEPVHVYTYSIV